jgi:hypothetical protein
MSRGGQKELCVDSIYNKGLIEPDNGVIVFNLIDGYDATGEWSAS